MVNKGIAPKMDFDCDFGVDFGIEIDFGICIGSRFWVNGQSREFLVATQEINSIASSIVDKATVDDYSDLFRFRSLQVALVFCLGIGFPQDEPFFRQRALGIRASPLFTMSRFKQSLLFNAP